MNYPWIRSTRWKPVRLVPHPREPCRPLRRLPKSSNAENGKKSGRSVRQDVGECLDHYTGEQGSDRLGKVCINLDQIFIMNGQHRKRIARPVVMAKNLSASGVMA